MSINETLNYLLATRHVILLNFSAQVSTSSVYLKSAGGEAGDGLPLPRDAALCRIDCWDGLQVVSSQGNISAVQGDRVSVYAEAAAGSFNVKVRLNGVDTTLTADGVNANATLWATVYLQLK